MYDVQDLANGEYIKEMITGEEVRNFFLDVYPHVQGNISVSEAIGILNLSGYRVHQID